jgi:hypothetical protein
MKQPTRKDIIDEVWTKWCDSSDSEFDTWLHDEINNQSIDVSSRKTNKKIEWLINPLINILKRTLALPFLIVFAFIGLTFDLLIMSIQFLIYGGEYISYKRVTKSTISKYLRKLEEVSKNE